MVIRPINFTPPPQVPPEMLQQGFAPGSFGEVPITQYQDPSRALGKKSYYEALLAQGMNSKPLGSGHWLEGLSRMLAGALGGYWEGEASRGKEGAEDFNKELTAHTLENADTTDPRIIAQLSMDPNPLTQSLAKSLMARSPTEMDKRQMALAEERELRELGEGVDRHQQNSMELAERRAAGMRDFNLGLDTLALRDRERADEAAYRNRSLGFQQRELDANTAYRDRSLDLEEQKQIDDMNDAVARHLMESNRLAETRAQGMRDYNIEVEKMSPEYMNRAADASPSLRPLSPERYQQQQDLAIRQAMPWMFLPQTPQAPQRDAAVQGIGDVPRPGISGADITGSMGLGGTAARGANAIGGLFQNNAGFTGVRDADIALQNIRQQAQAGVGAIAATGRPSVYHLQMVDKMLPHPSMFTNPDTALKQLTELKSFVEQGIAAEEDPRNFPTTAAQVGAKNQAVTMLRNLWANLDAIIMTTQQGIADRALPEQDTDGSDAFLRSMGR